MDAAHVIEVDDNDTNVATAKALAAGDTMALCSLQEQLPSRRPQMPAGLKTASPRRMPHGSIGITLRRSSTGNPR